MTLYLPILGGCSLFKGSIITRKHFVSPVLLDKNVVDNTNLISDNATNRDLIEYTLRLKYALDACNRDKDSIDKLLGNKK